MSADDDDDDDVSAVFDFDDMESKDGAGITAKTSTIDNICLSKARLALIFLRIKASCHIVACDWNAFTSQITLNVTFYL